MYGIIVRQFTSLLCDYVCDYVCQLKEISWNLLFLCPVISISFLWNKILKTLELYFRTTSWFELIIILSSVSRREMEQFQRIENWNYFLFPRTVELDVVRDYNILIPIFHYNPFIPLSLLILAVKHWTKGCAVLDTLCKIMVLHTCTHCFYIKFKFIEPCCPMWLHNPDREWQILLMCGSLYLVQVQGVIQWYSTSDDHTPVTTLLRVSH